MRDFVKKVQESKHDFAKELICIIPSSKMRHAFERKLLKEVANFNNVRFMTFQEWILHETENYRLESGLQLIDTLAQEMWVLEQLEQMDESILHIYQRNLTTAKVIVREFTFLREHGLNESHTNETTRPIFTNLFRQYDRFLQSKKATDYPQLLQIISKECKSYKKCIKNSESLNNEPVFPRIWKMLQEQKSDIVIAQGAKLSRLEKNIVSHINIRTLKDNLHIQSVAAYGFENAVEHALMPISKGDVLADEVHFVYTNASLLPTIYHKIKKLNIPATFASGIPIELTEAYYFVNKMIYYIENEHPLSVLQELATANILNLADRLLFNKLITIDGMTTGERFLAIVHHELKKEKQLNFISEQPNQVERLLEEMTELQNLITEIASGQANSLALFTSLFKKFYRHRSETEGMAKKAIESSLYAASALVDSNRFEISDLASLIHGQHIKSETEEAGCLHISSLADVGPLYRKYYCWFGMTTEEFANRGNNHPFVNYGILGEDIPDTEEKLSQLETKLQEHLRNKNVNHTLYLTKVHMERRQENNPILTYHMYAGRAEEVGYPKSTHVSDGKNDPLTNEANENISLKIEETSYSKEIYAKSEAVEDLFVFSPTSAIDLMKCSRKFMYERVMWLREDEVEQPERNRWLAFNLLGNLYHEILENYINEAMEQTPDVEAIIETSFNKYKKIYPPIYEELYLEEKKRATEVMENFVEKFNEDNEQGWHPVEAEASFGSRDEPVTIELEDDMYIQINGHIDRVDRQGEENRYRVTDYKTGNPKNANALQIALYEKAYKTLLGDEATFVGSYFDFIFNDERTVVSNLENDLASFKEQILNFKHHWDDIDYEEVLKSKACNYCHFKHLCAMRDKEVKS